MCRRSARTWQIWAVDLGDFVPPGATHVSPEQLRGRYRGVTVRIEARGIGEDTSAPDERAREARADVSVPRRRVYAR